jgi:hypothetical protein
MDAQELSKRFSYHPPKGDQAKKYAEVREAFTELALLLNDLCPESREKSVAFTELETAQFWANASIARNE